MAAQAVALVPVPSTSSETMIRIGEDPEVKGFLARMIGGFSRLFSE